MNHQERVLNAIKHKKVDRVPSDFWAEEPALERLFSFYGTKDLDSILKKFDVDIRHIDAIVPIEKKYLNVFGNEGRYICSPSHLFQPDIPPENIQAFYETVGYSILK